MDAYGEDQAPIHPGRPRAAYPASADEHHDQSELEGLLRRLMVVCPATGRVTDTGFELSGVPLASGRLQMLVDCIECGQDHQWRLEDSFLG